MKTLIILDGPEPMSRIKKRLKNNIVITSNPDVQKELQDMGIKYKTNEDYLDKRAYENMSREAILLVRKWDNLKVNGGNLKEFLTYRDLPFWDLINQSFATRLFEFSKKLNHVKLMKKIIRTEKPDKILAGDITILGRAAICVAKSFDVEVEKIGSGIAENLRYYYDTRLNYFFRYANRLKEFERTFFAGKTKKGFKGNKKKILIIPTIETETLVVAPVIKELEKNENYELLTLRIGSLRERMKKSLGRRGIENTPVEAFVTKETRKRSNDTVKFLKGRWEILKNSEEFKNSLKYMGIPVWDLVKEDFEFYFSTRARIIEIVKYVETIREILDKERPDIIVSLDELSELGKPMSLLARKREIPLLIIQHGLFGRGSPIFGPSMATKKCIWGPFTKRLLLERWFTKKQLVVTGCPKFDELEEKRSNKEIYRELGLDNGKPIITLLSQPIEGNENTATVVLKAMKTFPEKQLVVKLHPREYSENFYREAAKRIGVKIVITRDSDLHKLLEMSDLVIGMSSTACLEASIMNKPIMLVKTRRGSPLKPHFTMEGFPAISVYNEKDIEKTISVSEKRKGILEDMIRVHLGEV